MGRPRVAALPSIGAETVGHHEAASFDADPNAEAVRDAHGWVRRVVGERFGHPLMQLVVASRWRWY